MSPRTNCSPPLDAAQQPGLTAGWGEDRWPDPIDDRGQPDRETIVVEIERSLRAIVGDSQVFEIRLLGCDAGRGQTITVSGYFDDVEAAAQELAAAEEEYHPAGCYVTLNDVEPALLARGFNRLVERPRKTTCDSEIRRRTRLLLDFDPLRPSGISSTDAELAAADELATATASWLATEFGWPDPIRGSSGNGHHLVFAIDLPNDDPSSGLIQNVLNSLTLQRSNDEVHVDSSVFNAARITKIFGTVTRKGDHTFERPWRRARLRQVPEPLEVVTIERMQAVAAFGEHAVVDVVAREQAVGLPSAPSLDVKTYLSHYAIAFTELQERSQDRLRRFALAQCPFHPDHGGSSTCVLQGTDGRAGFKCFHERCQDYTWRDLVDRIGPPLPEHYESADGGLTEFSNFTGTGQQRVGRSALELAEDLRERTSGWPKTVTGQLFVVDSNDRPRFIERSSALFANLAPLVGQGGRINWANGTGLLTKDEFLETLRITGDQFDQIALFPHEPQIRRTFYCHPELPVPDGTYLDRFLDFFCPATEIDRALIRAFALTVFWGGGTGQRPVFWIDAADSDQRRGRGVGKTALATYVASLVGGQIELGGEKINRIKTRLLSPEGLGQRVVLLDNLKSTKFSWGDLEGLITSDVISGHRLFCGEGRRLNNLTWVVTSNSASLSTDMADRSVVIRLARHEPREGWDLEVREFINTHRWHIVADVLAQLQETPAPHRPAPRWVSWTSEVLSRSCDDPDRVQEQILTRRRSIDDDAVETDLVREEFMRVLLRAGHPSERIRVFIPSGAAAAIFNAALGTSKDVPRACSYLRVLQVPELSAPESGRFRGKRGFFWTGRACHEWTLDDSETEILDLEQVQRFTLDRRRVAFGEGRWRP